MRYRKPWNKTSTDWLITNYSNNSTALICKQLNLTRIQIYAKALQLGLVKSANAKSQETSMQNWNRCESNYSDNEVKDLLYKTRNYNYVAETTNRTISSISSMNFRYWRIPIRVWTEDKVKQLRKVFRNTSDKNIAKQLNVDVRSIQTKARKLGLQKSKTYKKALLKELGNRLLNSSNHWRPRGANHPRYIEDRTQVLCDRRVEQKFSKATKKLIRGIQQDKCLHCLKKLSKSSQRSFDHILALKFNGDNSADNCQLLCTKCHKNKTSYERTVSNHYRINPFNIV